MEYSSRGAAVKRKRVERQINQSRIYIKEDVSEDEEEDFTNYETPAPQWWQFWRESEEIPHVPLSAYTRPSFWQGQTGVYILLLIGIGFFVLVVNHYNAKQLERIKEEFSVEPAPVEPEQWWQHALLYNVIVRSFKDSNGDGIGDLAGWCSDRLSIFPSFSVPITSKYTTIFHNIPGLRQHINHFMFLGVDGVILSRLLESPFTDFGRDVSNFKDVDPVYGTLDYLKLVINELHENSK